MTLPLSANCPNDLLNTFAFLTINWHLEQGDKQSKELCDESPMA
jgi:hypothetical protein